MFDRQHIINLLDKYWKERRSSFFNSINQAKFDIIQKTKTLIYIYLAEDGSVHLQDDPLKFLNELSSLIALDRNENPSGKQLNIVLNKVISSICQNINFAELNNLLIETINKLGSLGEFKYSYSIVLNILNILNTLMQKQKLIQDAEIESKNYNILKAMNRKFDQYYKYSHKGMTWLENFCYYMTISLALITYTKNHFVFCDNLMIHELTMIIQNIETLVNHLQNNETPIHIEYNLITDLSIFIATTKNLIEDNFKTELYEKTNVLISTYNRFLMQKKLAYEFDWISDLPFTDKIQISPNSYPLALMN